jgi:hypothetical protein
VQESVARRGITRLSDFHERQSKLDVWLIALFLAAIAAPTADSWLRPDEARGPEVAELRVATSRPVLRGLHRDLLTYPARYDEYFKDSFGLRDVLLRWHSLEKLFVFGVSPTPMVVMGKDNWMMYTREESLEIFRGVHPFTDSDLEDWRRSLEGRRDYLARRGIEYVFVVGPNKESIYPEYEPECYDRVGPTRMDQLVSYLAAHSNFRILDLRPALIEARRDDTPDEHLYFELGTHWNGRGCLVASREVRKHLHGLFPRVPELDLSQVTREVFDNHGDSEARRMYVEDWFPQRHTGYSSLRPARIVNSGWTEAHPHRLETDDAELPRAIVFHDSFGPGIEPLCGECFSRSTWLPTGHFETSLIEAERPDVVIQIYVERVFAHPPQGISDEVLHAPVSNVKRPANASDVRYRLDPVNRPYDLEGLGGTRIERDRGPEGDSVAIVTERGSDLVALPEFPWPPNSRTFVELDITSPAATEFTLFYLVGGQTDYDRRNAETVHLSAGRNRVTVAILQEGIHGRLRFRPGFVVGRYLLHNMEISAVVSH